MKKTYRGCEIYSNREKCLGGWSQVYWGAFDLKDGYQISCDHTEGPVKDGVLYAKTSVDEYLDEYKSDQDKHSDRWSSLYK
jgi:hypothetical protein